MSAAWHGVIDMSNDIVNMLIMYSEPSKDEIVYNALMAVMREDGHFINCPCTNTHLYMPRSKSVQICQLLQEAIAKLQGEL